MYKCYSSYKVTSIEPPKDFILRSLLEMYFEQQFGPDSKKYRVLADLVIVNQQEHYVRMLLAIDDPSADNKVLEIQDSLRRGYADEDINAGVSFEEKFAHKKLEADAKFEMPVTNSLFSVCFGELEV